MPARDWDKIRRYDKAKSLYNPIESFRPRSRSNRRFRRLSAARPVPDRPMPTVSTKFLEVTVAGQFSYSSWLKKNSSWRCIRSQQPFEWFVRLVHPDLAGTFLRKNHFPFRWLDSLPQNINYDAQRTLQASEERPAEAYTAQAPSHAQAVNTSPSLNNDTQADACHCVKKVVKFPAAPSPCTGAEWLDHSSPLNAPVEQAHSNSD